MINEFSVTSQGQETPTYNNGSGGAPFHIFTCGTWEAKLRIKVKFDGCALWRDTPEWFNKNQDFRVEYPPYTKLKIVCEEWTEGTVKITVSC